LLLESGPPLGLAVGLDLGEYLTREGILFGKADDLPPVALPRLALGQLLLQRLDPPGQLFQGHFRHDDLRCHQIGDGSILLGEGGPKFCSMRITQDVRKLAADAKKLSLEPATA
jgi:hypothetical protein